MSERLAGKRAVVTGAGSGIGSAIAQRFAREGALVACADIDFDAARTCADAVSTAGGSAIAVGMDVTSPQSCADAAANVGAAFGGVDVVVANAGVNTVGDAVETSLDEWQAILAVNLTGVWLTNRAFLPFLIEAGGGSIVNQSSVTAVTAMRRVAAYAAAKGGVLALTRSIARDFSAHNVRANAILPGTVRTPMVERTYAARDGASAAALGDGLAEAATRYPRGRLGAPDDIASLAAFLASDDADWITGGAYVVDGGLTAVAGW